MLIPAARFLSKPNIPRRAWTQLFTRASAARLAQAPLFSLRRFFRLSLLVLPFAAPSLLPAQVSLATLVDMAAKNSSVVKLAQADLAKAHAVLSQSRDAFIPVMSFGSGLPAFPEIGFTGNLPTLWDGNVQSMVFSMSQINYIHAARAGVNAAELSLKEAHEQVALDTSTTYIELDTVNSDLAAVRQQEEFAGRLVEIEQQRAEAGVDPLSDLLQAQLTEKQIKLKRIHLESRAGTLASQLSALTGLPAGSIVPDHASIPVIPAVRADEAPRSTPGIESAQFMAKSREDAAKADAFHTRLFPEITFGALYNRNTTLLNDINKYYNTPLPSTDFSSGFSVQLPIFSAMAHAKAQESAAEALRAKVEVEQAQRQNDVAIAQLTGSLRELDTVAEIASLKQQIAAEQLKAVLAQLESGNGSGIGPGATPQLSPKAEQQARINERQNYQDSLDAGLDLSKARLNLLCALGHMQDWLDELHAK